MSRTPSRSISIGPLLWFIPKVVVRLMVSRASMVWVPMTVLLVVIFFTPMSIAVSLWSTAVKRPCWPTSPACWRRSTIPISMTLVWLLYRRIAVFTIPSTRPAITCSLRSLLCLILSLWRMCQSRDLYLVSWPSLRPCLPTTFVWLPTLSMLLYFLLVVVYPLDW